MRCDPLDPNDAQQGDNWDHVALDPEHRLVVSVVPGKRTAANTERLVQDFKERTGGRPMSLITSDEYAPYKTANRNSRKVRKTYCFSKDWSVHEAVTYFTMVTYNFCWPVRTLRVRTSDDHWAPRSPAMAAGLTDHVWSLHEWLAYPAVQRE